MKDCSKCHNATVTIDGDDREGTHYYVCSKCNNPCDLAVASNYSQKINEILAKTSPLIDNVKDGDITASEAMKISPRLRETKEAILSLMDSYADKRCLEVLSQEHYIANYGSHTGTGNKCACGKSFTFTDAINGHIQWNLARAAQLQSINTLKIRLSHDPSNEK